MARGLGKPLPFETKPIAEAEYDRQLQLLIDAASS
jgi:hypothetical protein